MHLGDWINEEREYEKNIGILPDELNIPSEIRPSHKDLAFSDSNKLSEYMMRI